MLVKNWMVSTAISVAPIDTLETALQVLDDLSFHRLPVVSECRIEGAITRSDIEREALKRCSRLNGAEFDRFVQNRRVCDLMSPETVIVSLDHTIEETAALFVRHHIHEAPVTDLHGCLAGIITRGDLLRALVSVTGARTGGILFAFLTPDRRDMVNEVADIIRNFGGRISSIFTTDTDAPQNMHKIYIRVTGIDRFRLNPLSQKLEEKVTLIYRIDRPEVRKDFGSGLQSSDQDREPANEKNGAYMNM